MDGAEIEAALSEVCGQLNAAHARLVALVAEVLASRCWEGAGILTCEQWVAWKTGLSPGRARDLVAVASRQGELPVTMAAFSAGELAVDQVVVVARHVPTDCEAQAADLARLATVSQLRRSLSRYQFHPEPARDPVQPEPDPCGVSGWYDAQGRWRLRACLNPTKAPSWPRLWPRRGTRCSTPVTLRSTVRRRWWRWPNAPSTPSKPHTARRLPGVIHVATDGAHLHDGPALPDVLRRMILCDTTGAIVGVRGGRPLDIGRRRHIVPLALRQTIELRDRGCRVPGCSSRRIQVHHILHWEDGGPTDAHNLVGLCPKHHRMHHRGLLGITGNPTRPDGLCFTDRWGHPLRAPPPPPINTDGPIPVPMPDVTGTWRHPLGERLYTRWLTFTADTPARPLLC